MKGVTWRVGVTMRDLEKNVIEKAMLHFDNNKTKVAAALGLSLRTIDNKVNLYKQQAENEATKSS